MRPRTSAIVLLWGACRLVPGCLLWILEATSTVTSRSFIHYCDGTGEMLEIAVQLSVHLHDDAAFERNFQQLRALYMDTRCQLSPHHLLTVFMISRSSASRKGVGRNSGRPFCHGRSALPPSQCEGIITGLNLLRLLVQNRIAEFHTELETITSEVGPQWAHELH